MKKKVTLGLYAVLALAFHILINGIAPVYAASTAPPAPVLKLTVEEDGSLLFQWNTVKDADYYRLMLDEKETGHFRQVGNRITGISFRYEAPDHDVLSKHEPQYRVEACNDGGCTPSNQTNATQATMLNSPMTKDLEKAFDDLLGGSKKTK